MMPSNQLFQCPTALSNINVAREGMESGTYNCQSTRICPAPSTNADSTISLGNPLKKLSSTTTENTDTAPGKINAHRLFNNPNSFMIM